MDPELRAALDELRQHVDTSATETRQRVDTTAVETRRHVDATAVETRRHFDVAGEALLAKIQLVAEGVSELSERLDRTEANLREEILRAQRELSAMLRFSYADLDRKIQALESRVTDLGQQCGDLEARVHRLESGR